MAKIVPIFQVKLLGIPGFDRLELRGRGGLIT